MYHYHSGATWLITSDGVEGPLCNRCHAALEGPEVIGHNEGKLICSECKDDHLLGPEPRTVAEVRAEVHEAYLEYRRKGILASLGGE